MTLVSIESLTERKADLEHRIGEMRDQTHDLFLQARDVNNQLDATNHQLRLLHAEANPEPEPPAPEAA